MNLQDLLNADVSSIGEWARQGLAWWIDELSTLLPSDWRDRLSSRTRRVIEPGASGGWRLWQNGRLLADGKAARPGDGSVGLVLPADEVLTRRLELPRLPLSDVRRMVALDIDRLSPLAPGLVYHDLTVIDRDVGEGKQAVLLGVAPRETVLRRLEAARADGFEPVVIGAAVTEGSPAYRFDFLPAARAELGESDGRRVLRYWWAAVGVLVLINLATLVARDMIDVSRLQQAVDDQHGAVAAASQLRRRVQSEDTQRRDLIARQTQNDPLHILDALTRAIASNAWVQRLEWNGQTLRIVGFKTGDVDLLAALRSSPVFSNPRSATGDAPVKAGAPPPFDITVDAPRRPTP